MGNRASQPVPQHQIVEHDYSLSYHIERLLKDDLVTYKPFPNISVTAASNQPAGSISSIFPSELPERTLPERTPQPSRFLLRRKKDSQDKSAPKDRFPNYNTFSPPVPLQSPPRLSAQLTTNHVNAREWCPTVSEKTNKIPYPFGIPVHGDPAPNPGVVIDAGRYGNLQPRARATPSPVKSSHFPGSNLVAQNHEASHQYSDKPVSDPLAEKFQKLRLAHFGRPASAQNSPRQHPFYIPPAEPSGQPTSLPATRVVDLAMTKGRHPSQKPRHVTSGPYPHTSRKVERKRVPIGRSERLFTPESSDDATSPDLTRPLKRIPSSRTVTPDLASTPKNGGIAVQTAFDRELAAQLQDDEEITYVRRSTPFNFSNTSVSSNLMPLRSNNPYAQAVSSGPAHRSTRKYPGRGIAADPIDLDVDDDYDVFSYQLQQAAYKELVPSSYDVEQINIDAQLARKLQEIENNRKKQETTMPIRECAVCNTDIAVQDFPLLADCTHQPETCADCFASWIASELESKSWKEIRCPGNKCSIMLQHHEVQRYASAEVYHKFDALSARSALNDEPNFRWCIRPGCSSGQIHESGEEGNIFTCGACGFKVCVIHEDNWHEDMTCEQYDYEKSGQKEHDRKVQEQASLRAISELTKKCPGKNCGWNIQKTEGCDHMTCSRCRYEFCWICFASYASIRSKGNSEHHKNCKYHTSSINSRRR